MNHTFHLRSLLLGASAALTAVGGTSLAADPALQETKTDMAQSEMTSDDPFLWLEEVEGDRALTWVREQNERSLKELQSDPHYQTLLDEAKSILTSDERIASAALRGGYAYNFWQDDEHVRGIWRRMPITDYVAGGTDWDVILDIDALAKEEDENWVYEGASCLEPDYDRCIMTLSRGGSDAAVKREYLISERAFVEDGFDLAEAKSSAAWLSQDSLLVGTNLGEETVTDSGYARQIREWQRGTAIEDAPVVFEIEKSDMGVWPFASHKDGKTVAGVSKALNFYEFEIYLRQDDGSYEKMPFPLKSDFSGLVDDKIILSLNENWAYGGSTYKIGSVVAFDPADESVELVYEPADRVAVDGISTANDMIALKLLDNINGKIITLQHDGTSWVEKAVDLPDAGVVSVSSVDDETGNMLVYYENPTTPETLYFVEKGEAPKPIKSTPAFFNTDGIETRQFEAISSDGTAIPYFVMGKTDVLDAGPAPTIQYGYGGFQISILPQYSATTGKLWLENGGIYVIANIRGGGEFGPEWHQAGLKQKRQLIYDDFFAVSESLIEKKITTTEQLGILGGSNGGLLMGVSMTQRPDLYKAVGIGVPLLDMLRYHKLLAGASWMGEYGNPDIPAERAFLETISPYQNLKEGVDYPRPYFFTSTKDDRVHPGHARKMARKMAEYGYPFLYYENIEGGHGAAANQDQLATRLALQFVYFANELGLDW
ncbi:prolyl oligopeptidase family serine peptidase [Parvularcula sp. LCG005]|uniref:prolyl oligopeptidase family serine peptidase n=1 Tax=Parvularcula sp. LCG005 TaxID=3078805 RepID=UPI002942939B|nr:prolyl oligopeptidase family serine peptidase [Parvularcula sp. LCG005]WOI53296.1 prolyl oligopeptidase family serine peptidase [Parvularcula sp. LCG005]